MKQPNFSSKIIQSVDRALEILDCYNGGEIELSLSNISDRLLLNKSTALGLINTMIARGYMEKSTKTGRYRLGPAFIQKPLLNAQARSNYLYDVGSVLIKRIALKYKVNTFLHSYSNYMLICVDAVREDMSVKSEVTSHKMSYHASASGKLVLAQFSEQQLEHYLSSTTYTVYTPFTIIDPERIKNEIIKIRQTGISPEIEEVEEGLHAYALSIVDSMGNMVGTISASGKAALMTSIKDELLADMTNAMHEICKKIE